MTQIDQYQYEQITVMKKGSGKVRGHKRKRYFLKYQCSLFIPPTKRLWNMWNSIKCTQYNYQMMSTKTQKLSGQLKNPFSNFSNPYNNYSLTLENNFQILRKRFPTESMKKLRGLLQEMDNNLEMTIDILEEDGCRQQKISAEKICHRAISTDQQNVVLKKAVAKLYKKLREKEKESEQLKETNEKLRKENEYLSVNNRFLIDTEFNRRQFEEEKDIF